MDTAIVILPLFLSISVSSFNAVAFKCKKRVIITVESWLWSQISLNVTPNLAGWEIFWASYFTFLNHIFLIELEIIVVLPLHRPDARTKGYVLLVVIIAF